jgi:hypothetical protein
MLNRTLTVVAVISLLLLCCTNPPRPMYALGHLPANSDQKVITSLINNKTKVIAICYGNELAVQAANDMHAHQGGESYTLVTWQQRPMPQWYGTNMNGKLLSIETVNVTVNGAGKLSYAYKFQSSLQSSTTPQAQNSEARIRFISNQRAAVFPN